MRERSETQGEPMSSQRRIDSSRANGAKSRGPVTAEGRARSDMAPVTHGLTARQVLLENESEADFLTLHDLYMLHFQPRNPYEKDLVEQLIAARWRLDRTWAYETALLEVEVGRCEPDIEEEFDRCSDTTRNALALRSLYEESPVLAGLSRYEVRFRRICDKISKRLESRRANQKTNEEPSPINGHLRIQPQLPPSILAEPQPAPTLVRDLETAPVAHPGPGPVPHPGPRPAAHPGPGPVAQAGLPRRDSSPRLLAPEGGLQEDNPAEPYAILSRKEEGVPMRRGANRVEPAINRPSSAILHGADGENTAPKQSLIRPFGHE